MSDKNMALLSQDEIDALIEFLTLQKGSEKIKSDILSQESINKLIQIIKSAQLLGKPLPFGKENTELPAEDFLSSLGINDKKDFNLVVRFDNEKGICLYASHSDAEELFSITPGGLMKEVSCNALWGACIAPSTFHFISEKLNLPYSEETFLTVKKRFAKVMYGDEEAVIPSFYLP